MEEKKTKSSERVEEVMKRVLFEMKKNRNSPKNRLVDEWGKIAGERLSRHTKVEKIEKETLFILVDDPAWALEIRSKYQMSILKRIQNQFGNELVKQIKIRQG